MAALAMPAVPDSLDLRQLARRFGDRPALRSPGGSVSYDALPGMVAALAGWLAGHDVGDGDIVALTGTTADADRIMLPLTLLAAASLGAVATLPPARAPAARQSEMLAGLGPVRLSVAGEVPLPAPAGARDSAATDAQSERAELRRADPEHPTRSPRSPRAAVPVPVATPTLEVLAELAATAAPPAPLAAGRQLSILFTSGSGGTPKAVVHTLGNHLASAAASAHRLPLTTRDSWLACLPLSHIGGLAILFRTLAAGARMELAAAGRFTDPGRPEVAALRSCTHASIVDTQLRRLLSLPPAALDQRPHLLVGGSAIRRHLMEAARQRGVPVYATYGCTEMCSQVATTGGNATRRYAPDRATVAAEPLPGQRVRVAATGEVLLGGPTLAAGYLRAGRLRPLVDDAGWYHSGDVGRLLPDGRLVITGRRDAMFISGGENVQPERIERALLQHPAVLAACCVPRVDDEFGARPVAFLQLEGAEWASSAAPPEELLRLATNELALHERPAAYLPMPDFGSGKPDRSALTRIAAGTGGS